MQRASQKKWKFWQGANGMGMQSADVMRWGRFRLPKNICSFSIHFLFAYFLFQSSLFSVVDILSDRFSCAIMFVQYFPFVLFNSSIVHGSIEQKWFVKNGRPFDSETKINFYLPSIFVYSNLIIVYLCRGRRRPGTITSSPLNCCCCFFLVLHQQRPSSTHIFKSPAWQ